MSVFTKSRLICDLVDDRFILQESIVWEVGELGSGLFFTVPVGFKTDFASIPWFLQWYIGKFGKHNLAALLHDYLYSKAKNKDDKTYADFVFHQALIASVVDRRKANYMYLAVSYFGKLPKDRRKQS